jgi:hypothetical protein
VLKAIGCNLVPHITEFPSALFPLGESDIPEHFLYAVLTHIYVSSLKSGKRIYGTKRKLILKLLKFFFVFFFLNRCSCGTYIYFPAAKGKLPYRADAIENLFLSYSQPHHPVLDKICHEGISKEQLDSNTGPFSQ